ncbi:MAG: dihydrofolate reductase [Candidatus Pacebacteria bacterium]|nr:dihydrofolate reductase [Candidatus Paceibacterota bacterium]
MNKKSMEKVLEKKNIVSLIVACDNNFIIGNGSKIPWHLPADFAYFKKTTLNYPVIMGQITFESILNSLGKPLPKRENIVLTKDKNYKYDGVKIVYNLESAIEVAKKNNSKEVFVIGGASVYKLALEQGVIDRIYLTKINAEVDGDIYFPKEFLKNFKQVNCVNFKKDDKNKYDMEFLIFEKK